MFQSAKRSVAQSAPRCVRFKKSPAPRRAEKIPVQLYTDVAGLGNTGEIVRVRPAYMRNVLHRDNGAGYVLKNQEPLLPVVEKSSTIVEPKDTITVETIETVEISVTVEKKSDSSAMSLNELTDLFSSMKTSRSRIRTGTAAQSFAASEGPTFSVEEIRSLVPTAYTVNTSKLALPVTKGKLAAVLFDISGTEVPAAAISIQDSSSADVSEITEKGKYVWVITSTDKKSVTIKLDVI